ncbi:hypothetical protein [Streptomyces sp. NPDC089919]|uniref:hypothetical protein n=1 Tax=Streptomyces sp. NPDC089919 TaxID=3155188 RepID=UPI0034190F76
MPVIEFSVAPHPSAKPGFGKVTAPDELPRTDADFSHLPLREEAVARYLDRLPDGADISVKTLAAVLPLWGQCALRTALNRLETAGHLHRVRERAEGVRWVTRTYFSRTARDGGWWARFTGRSTPAPTAPPPPARPEPPPPAAGSAYGVLAELARVAPTLALTAGLPRDGVHHPAAFVRRRLASKLPPPRPTEPEPGPAVDTGARIDIGTGTGTGLRTRLAECRECRAPGRPAAFTDGLCATCRHEPPPPPTGPLTPAEVRAHATRIREGRPA